MRCPLHLPRQLPTQPAHSTVPPFPTVPLTSQRLHIDVQLAQHTPELGALLPLQRPVPREILLTQLALQAGREGGKRHGGTQNCILQGG